MPQSELAAYIAAGGAPCKACGQRMLKADGLHLDPCEMRQPVLPPHQVRRGRHGV